MVVSCINPERAVSPLHVLRLADGKLIRVLDDGGDSSDGEDDFWGGSYSLRQAAVDVGGGRVASGGGECVLRVWDVLAGTLLQEHSTGRSDITCLVGLWGNRVATGQGSGNGSGSTGPRRGDIALWSLRGGGRAAGVLRGHRKPVWTLAVLGARARGQRRLASGGADHIVRVWNPDKGACAAILRGHTGGVRGLADLGNGRLLSAADDNSLRVWDPCLKACLAVVANAHMPPDGMRYAGMLTTASRNGWDLTCCCSIAGGAATGSEGEVALRLWRWDEPSATLAPAGAGPDALEAGRGVYKLALGPPGPGGAQQLLAGCKYDGCIQVLGRGQGGELAQAQSLETGCVFDALAVMQPREAWRGAACGPIAGPGQ